MSRRNDPARVLIAIPVFNEATHASRVLDEVRSFHRDVLVVDDGSSDATPDILQGRADVKSGEVRVIRHATNSGYGQSLITAFEYAGRAGFDWVITMDCDEQHEPRRIPAFLERLQAAHHCDACPDIVSGTRYTAGDVNGDAAPADRKAINMTLTAVLNHAFGVTEVSHGMLQVPLTDSFCGFKAHRVKAMAKLNLTETGYAFPMQLWPQAALAGLVVEELPVPRIYNDPNRTFGGQLDDPDRRLRHYVDVLRREVKHPAVAITPAVLKRQRDICVRLEEAIARYIPQLAVPLMTPRGVTGANVCDKAACCCK